MQLKRTARRGAGYCFKTAGATAGKVAGYFVTTSPAGLTLLNWTTYKPRLKVVIVSPWLTSRVLQNVTIGAVWGGEKITSFMPADLRRLPDSASRGA